MVKHIATKTVMEIKEINKVDQPVGGPFPKRAVVVGCCLGEPQKEGL